MEREEVIAFVQNTLYEGDFGYALRAYLNRNHWNPLLIQEDTLLVMENLTDFNYSRCFSYIFYEAAALETPLFTEEATEEIIRREGLEFISLKISAVGPFYTIAKGKYIPNGNKLLYDTPLTFTSLELERKVRVLAEKLNEIELFSVKPEELSLPLTGVPLENYEGEERTYFRYLFE